MGDGRLTGTSPHTSVGTPRIFALLATVGLLASVLSVLFKIVQVDGNPMALFVLAGGSLLAATFFARAVPVSVAFVIAAVVLSIGHVWYLISLPYEPQVVDLLRSNLELLTGQSILEIKRSSIWALAVTPAPMFITWYLALREWYTVAGIVGGVTLGYFVLTGDAGTTVTILGVVSGLGLLGFGDLADTIPTADTGETSSIDHTRRILLMELAGLVIAAQTLDIVPTSGGTVEAISTGSGDTTIEASIVETDSNVDIVGDISLSPEVRFTVTAAEKRFWRTSSYDRYTGDGWIRTGDPESYNENRLEFPPGQSRRLEQTFTAKSPIETMPAAWRPIDVSDSFQNRTKITNLGGLQPSEPLDSGESYQVVSAVLDISTDDLRTAGSRDPQQIADRFTQVPASTPDRVRDQTETITADASNRYETARTIERWLEEKRDYSLEVDKPTGNVADAFLFEMEQGYCTYYATTMAVMLRTLDAPARLTVGYTPGEQVGENKYVIRGYNSHAWVEVYFPDIGWIAFDPTPAGPRVEAEQEQLDRARSADIPNIDTAETNVTTSTPQPETNVTTTPTPTPTNPNNLENTTPPEIQSTGSEQADSRDDAGLSVWLPSRTQLALASIVGAGAIAGVRQTDLPTWVYRTVWLRLFPRTDPATDIERAFDNLMFLLERHHREREEGETVRQYLDDIDADPRARQVAELRERARYGEVVTEEMADTAVELVKGIHRQHLPFS